MLSLILVIIGRRDLGLDHQQGAEPTQNDQQLWQRQIRHSNLLGFQA